MSLSAFAQTASGKTVVPPFDSRYASSSSQFQDSFFVTNITSSPITVILTIYNQTGTMVTSGVSVVSGTGAGVTNFALNSGGGTASLTLAANATTHLSYVPSTLDCSYATIAWTQSNSTALFGLLADVKENYLGGSALSIRTIAVNENRPF